MIDLDTEAPAKPRLPAEIYSQLRHTLESQGPVAAAEALCQAVRDIGDPTAYFYAMLVKKRVEWGISAFPAGPAASLPDRWQDAYEDAIREAGRAVGQWCIERGNLSAAWQFFHMLGEPMRMRDALEAYQPRDDDDVAAVIEIAWNQGVHPKKGFDLILQRNGICNAITMYSYKNFGDDRDLQNYCIRQLLRHLYDQLRERLCSDLASRGIEPAPELGVEALLLAYPDLVGEDSYHIDTSHLSSVLRFALHLSSGGEELQWARELCAYGQRLGSTFQLQEDPPFERPYFDWRCYFDLLAGVQVEENLLHFRAKIAASSAEGNTLPAEVMVNLLLKLQRETEALHLAREYLIEGNPYRPLTCPDVYELCHRVNDLATLSEVAQARGDGVSYLASLIEMRKK